MVEHKRLGDVLTFQRGFDITRKNQRVGDVPIISSSGIHSYHNNAKANGPGIVIGRKGTLGTVHYIRGNYWPHDTTLWVKNFKGTLPEYLRYFLPSLKLEFFDVGASNPTLNRNHLHKLQVKVSPPKDQQKIAAVLTAYDDLIENNRQRIALLEKMAEEIYREWFVRLRFPGHEHTPTHKGVPEGWEPTHVGDMYQTISGGTPSRTRAEYFGGSIPWVKTGELKQTFISQTDEQISEVGLENSAAKLLPAGTVVMAMYCAMEDVTILATDAATNQACCALRPKFDYLGPEFTYHLMRSAMKELTAWSHGAAQQNLSQTLIKAFPVFNPGATLITKYCDAVQPIFAASKNAME